MNATSPGIGHQRPAVSDEPKADNALDAAWLVLEAANDLGDNATVEASRRVIDAGLNGAAASQADLHIVLDYFR